MLKLLNAVAAAAHVAELAHRRRKALGAPLGTGGGRAERGRLHDADWIRRQPEGARHRRRAGHRGHQQPPHRLAARARRAGQQRGELAAQAVGRHPFGHHVPRSPRRAESRVDALVKAGARDDEGAADDVPQARGLRDVLLKGAFPAARARAHRLDQHVEHRRRRLDVLVLWLDTPRKEVAEIVLRVRVEDTEDAGRGRFEYAGLAVFDKDRVRRGPDGDERGVVVKPRDAHLLLAVGALRPGLAAKPRLAKRHRLAGPRHGPVVADADVGEGDLDGGANGEAHRREGHPRLGLGADRRPRVERRHAAQQVVVCLGILAPLRSHRLKPVADELFDELRPQGPLHGAARGCHVVHGVDADAALEHFKRKLVKVFGPKRKVDTGSRLAEQPHSAFECLVQPRVAEAGVPRPQLGFSQGLTSGRLRPRQDGWRWNCTLL